MSASRPYKTDPFHPLGSIFSIKQLQYIGKTLQVTSFMWYAQVSIYDNCAYALAGTLKLRFTAILKLFCFSSARCW